MQNEQVLKNIIPTAPRKRQPWSRPLEFETQPITHHCACVDEIGCGILRDAKRGIYPQSISPGRLYEWNWTRFNTLLNDLDREIARTETILQNIIGDRHPVRVSAERVR